MDDWNLDEKSLSNKWQQLQHWKSIIMPKFFLLGMTNYARSICNVGDNPQAVYN